MMVAHPDTRRWLADLISPDQARTGGCIAALDESRWTQVLEMAARHRVLPLLHWRVSQLPLTEGLVPAHVVERLGREMLGATQRALAALGAVRSIDGAFERAGVPGLFLKGIHLAVAIYPQPGLRPMRDVDVLVPQGQVAEALAALESLGAVRDPSSSGDLDAWRQSRHHLPAMVMPGGLVRVELHTSLSPDTVIARGGLRTIPQWDDLWRRASTIDCVGRRIHVLSPEDLLLHLVVHGMYHHRFSNGPLFLSDVGFLVAREQIDWDVFWIRAREQGADRGCALVLRLVEREWGISAVRGARHGEPVSESVLDAGATLLMQESALENDLLRAQRFAVERGRLRETVRQLIGSVCPARRDLALMYPVRGDSLAAFAWYPRHWWRLVTRRLPEYLRYRRRPGVDIDIKALGVLEAWLRRAE